MGSFGNLTGEGAAGFLDDLIAGPYFDRTRPAAATVAAMRPHFAALGITRVSRQTGLDKIGIPCWASFRPNALSLSGNQGKGVTDAAACASAIMEAAEFAIAERPEVPTLRDTAGALTATGRKCFDPTRLLLFGSEFDEDQMLDWVEGRTLFGNEPCWVPVDTVNLDGSASQLPGICKTTNGLASGNVRYEAVFHALCELIERDATSLWSLASRDKQIGSAISLSGFGDPLVDYLSELIGQAGLTLRLFDQTSDLGIPAIMALIGPTEAEGAMEFSVTAGYGAHPIAVRAALRAITEAAQSRIGLIAGSRDDIDPGRYERSGNLDHAALLGAEGGGQPPEGLPLGTPPALLLDTLRDALSAAEIDPLVVPLGGCKYGISVVKVLSSDLEDREPNLNWRPGRRALNVILQP